VLARLDRALLVPSLIANCRRRKWAGGHSQPQSASPAMVSTLHTLASGTNPCQVLRHPCLRSPARTTPRSQRSRCNREPTPQSYHFPRHCTDEISMLFQLVSLLQNTLSRPGLRLREAQSPSRISLAQFHRLLRLAGG
jgi:hypothetical protein